MITETRNKKIKTSAVGNEDSIYLATEACSIYPQTSSGGRRSSIYAMNWGRGCGRGRVGGRFGGRGIINDSGRGRGRGRRDGNDKFINGVGISNPNRLFAN